MKLTLVFVLVAFGYFVSADIDEQIIAHSNDCMKETGVAMDLVTKLKNHDLSSEDPKLKCFVKCMCHKADLCDEYMNLNVAKVEDHVPEDKRHMMDDAIGTCSPTVGSDDCDTIYKKLKCFYGHFHP